MQAGSFKTNADADRRRAELLLLGLEAKIEAVEANGDTWHRVYVGPFTSRSKLSKARTTLISEGIETLLLKRKVAG
nr:SPOR domain-containing protein [Litorivivens lipolytica]